KVHAGTRGIFLGLQESVHEIGTASFHNARAQVHDFLELYRIGICGEKNSSGDTYRLCGPRHRRSVITGAGSGNFDDVALAEIGGQRVEGPARFKRAGGKSNLQFKKY